MGANSTVSLNDGCNLASFKCCTLWVVLFKIKTDILKEGGEAFVRCVKVICCKSYLTFCLQCVESTYILQDLYARAILPSSCYIFTILQLKSETKRIFGQDIFCKLNKIESSKWNMLHKKLKQYLWSCKIIVLLVRYLFD